LRKLIPVASFLLAASALAGDELKVLTVLAPGSGSNYTTEGTMPPGTDSQLQMYDQLPDALDDLDRSSLDAYFKPAEFDVDPGNMATVTRLRPGVRIVRDGDHNVPHVYGETRADAMFGVGYVRAEDRLWQMEWFRAHWRAASAVLLGPGEDNANIKADAETFRLIDYSEAEYEAMFNRLKTAYGHWGIQAAEDIEQYIDGMNAYLKLIEANPSLLPVEFVNRDLKPRPWRVTDAMAMAAYSHISWGSAGPGEESNAQVLRQLQEKFGSDAQTIFNDLRNAPDASSQHSLPPASGTISDVNVESVALPDLNSFVQREIVSMADGPVATSRPGTHSRNSRSNALLVAARHSVTGRPIAVQGPQDGYGTPHLFDTEIVIVAPDFRARGILELSGPYPYVAARGDGYAWSITILQPDQADTYVEVLCEPDGSEPGHDSMHYVYKGECLALQTRIDVRATADGGTYSLTSMRSVHGPVIGRATVEGRPVALAQARTMYLHEEMDYPAHAQLFSPSVVRSAADFIEIVAGTAYNIGWWYIDTENIAGVDAGLIPVRRDGASTDLPIWGTGNWDWVGFDPRSYTFRTPLKSQYPQAINGPDGVIAGWNNHSAAGWPLKDEAWNYSGANRVQLLKEPTMAAVTRKKISIVDLVKIHTEAAITDYHAQRVYPTLRRFIGSVPDPALKELLQEADKWSREGGYRRDTDGDGYLEHGPAILLLDSFWTLLVKNAFTPLLGPEMLAGAGIANNLPSLTPGPSDANAWVMKIVAGAQGYLDPSPEPPPNNYCGKTEAVCRKLILDSLAEAYFANAETYGDVTTMWRVPATCDGGGCRQITFSPTGDMTPVQPISWQNRGTYIQVTTGEQTPP
jgi:acyl-homoserine lactone acylase PvdQ